MPNNADNGKVLSGSRSAERFDAPSDTRDASPPVSDPVPVPDPGSPPPSESSTAPAGSPPVPADPNALAPGPASAAGPKTLGGSKKAERHNPE